MSETDYINTRMSEFRRRYGHLNCLAIDYWGVANHFTDFIDTLKPEWGDTSAQMFKLKSEFEDLDGRIKFDSKVIHGFRQGQITHEGKSYELVYEALPFQACRENNTMYLVGTSMDRARFQDLFAEFSVNLGLDRDSVHVFTDSDIRRPTNTWNDIVLPQQQLDLLRKTADTFFLPETKEMYARLSLAHKRGLLLVGPPGVGKSLACRILLSNTTVQGCILPLKTKLEDEEVRKAFHFAAATRRPTILVLEDLDRFSQSMASLGYLLNQMDGVRTNSGLLVVATANNPENIDRALLHRPSRFDTIISFGLPDTAERCQLIHRLNLRANSPFSVEAEEKLVKDTKGFSPAYIQEVITSAMLTAIYKHEAPGDAHLRESLAIIRKQMKYAAKYKALDNPEEEEKGSIGFGASSCPSARSGI